MKEKNITERMDELFRKNPKDSELTIPNKVDIEVYKDPVYLSQSINRELVELNKITKESSKSLSVIQWILLGIFLFLIIIAFK